MEPLKPLETFILVGILKTFYLAEKPLITFILINNRVPTVREKSVKNEKSSRSGKSQGILN